MRPTELSYTVVLLGVIHGANGIRLEGETLSGVLPDGQTVSARPTEQQWTEFAQTCEKAGLWSLPPEYQNRGVLDAGRTDLTIRIGERCVRVSAYALTNDRHVPPNLHTCLVTIKSALDTLLGTLPAAVPDRPVATHSRK